MADSARASLITGLAGSELTSGEVAFLAEVRPCGIILFTRNFQNNAQLTQLVQDARDAIGSLDLLVFVDQEGGRVQRLKGADWPDLPPAAAYGALYEIDAQRACDAARVISRWLGACLRKVGINANCAPCLDVPVPEADAIIGDRAYSCDPKVVAELGSAVAGGLMQGGVLPVMKHIPGHGRAGVDSHLALPTVQASAAELDEADFAPFAAMKELPAAMTAHVTYVAFDDRSPASISAAVTAGVIRDRIGFDGLLMSDDISMQALDGTLVERAQSVISSGSDVVLHCNGVLDEMQSVANMVPKLSGAAAKRFQDCLAVVGQEPSAVDSAAVSDALAAVQRAYQQKRSSGV